MEGNKARTENCGRDAKLKKGRKGTRMKVEVSDGREWKEGPGWRWVGWGQVGRGVGGLDAKLGQKGTMGRTERGRQGGRKGVTAYVVHGGGGDSKCHGGQPPIQNRRSRGEGLW
jgi:hypothetical protein